MSLSRLCKYYSRLVRCPLNKLGDTKKSNCSISTSLIFFCTSRTFFCETTSRDCSIKNIVQSLIIQLLIYFFLTLRLVCFYDVFYIYLLALFARSTFWRWELTTFFSCAVLAVYKWTHIASTVLTMFYCCFCCIVSPLFALFSQAYHLPYLPAFTLLSLFLSPNCYCCWLRIKMTIIWRYGITDFMMSFNQELCAYKVEIFTFYRVVFKHFLKFIEEVFLNIKEGVRHQEPKRPSIPSC